MGATLHIGSVAEPAPFLAAPDVRRPGADAGFGKNGSAPGPGKKERLHAAPTSASDTKIYH